MGQRVSIFDDLDDKLDAERTVTFAIDGTAYEIDLHQTNIDKLHAALDPFIESGRRAGRATPVKSASGTRKAGNPELDAIRHWAGKNGFRVSNKGRIPTDVQDAYDAAHAPRAEGTKPAAKVAEPAFSAAPK